VVGVEPEISESNFGFLIMVTQGNISTRIWFTSRGTKVEKSDCKVRYVQKYSERYLIKRVKVPPPLLSYLSAECSRALVVGLKTRGFSYDISESAVLSKMSKYLPVLLRDLCQTYVDSQLSNRSFNI